MTAPNHEPGIPRSDNLGPEIAVVEVGGVEDTQVRPLRESLRKHIKKGVEQQAPPPPKEISETSRNESPKMLGPDSLNMDIIEAGGEEDTRIRPIRESLRKSAEEARKRYLDNGGTAAP